MSAVQTYVLCCDGCEAYYVALYDTPRLLSTVRSEASRLEGWTHKFKALVGRSGPMPTEDLCGACSKARAAGMVAR